MSGKVNLLNVIMCMIASIYLIDASPRIHALLNKPCNHSSTSITDSRIMVAQRFGRYFMYHLMSVHSITELCANITGYKKDYLNLSEMDTCLTKGLDKIIDKLILGNDWVACSAIYYMLSDLAAEDPDRRALLSTSSKSLSRYGDISTYSKKLTCNKVFNWLYEKYLVRPCMTIVEQLVPEDLSDLPVCYYRLAQSACNILILNPHRLQQLPRVVANEKYLIRLGNVPFRYRLPK